MATFPSVTQGYGATKSSSPNIRGVQFNDGYMHRIKFGMNIDPKIWNLSWVNISETNADSIETFLEARADDGASFDWTPPGSSVAYKWVCLSWVKTIPYVNKATIRATFQEVFEP
tara:strand:- start:1239 stop:1583 length:345 start_codon:yes stop_codon:yes gene_type:complete